jgi:NAD+ kinase
MQPPEARASWRIGVVVHPSRDIEDPLHDLLQWSRQHGVEVVQIPVGGQDREVAPPGRAGDCDLIVSIGGDGTMLGALRAAVPVQRPVLGVTCGSLGALTSLTAGDFPDALGRFSRGEWLPRPLPALEIARDDEEGLFALNDIAVVRAGIGQVRTSIHLDGELYCQIAGDGCIVSTQLGSSAYAIAAGGPLLAAGAGAYVLTPLPTHGGSCPPLVVGADSVVRLQIRIGAGAARLEVDGQPVGAHEGWLTIGLRPDVATLVELPDQESLLAGLRRRRVIVDSPRILAEEHRTGSAS